MRPIAARGPRAWQPRTFIRSRARRVQRFAPTRTENTMPDAIALDLRARREAVIRAHADAESCQDVEATLKTFHRPRYEVVPLGEPIDGAANVRELLKGLLEGFPDFHAAIDRMHHSESVVSVELRMLGTHRGPWAGIPPTGRRIDGPALSLFKFDGDKLECEKVYFDMATLMRQLGAIA